MSTDNMQRRHANTGQCSLQEGFFAADDVSQSRFAQQSAGRAMARFIGDFTERPQYLLHSVAIWAFELCNKFLVQFEYRIQAQVCASDAQQIVERRPLGARREFSDIAISPMRLAVFAG